MNITFSSRPEQGRRARYLCYVSIALVILVVSCQPRSEKRSQGDPETDSLETIRKKEAREDSLELALALSLQQKFTNRVVADLETPAVESLEGEDAADDPAIWYNENDPGKSLVLGTNKTAGLYVYDLEGNVLQYRRVGRINNVDLRDGFPYRGKEVVLVAASNRSINAISIFIIDKETGELSDSLVNIQSGVDEVYGICCYRSPKRDEFDVFVNGKGGMIEQWNIRGTDGIEAKMLRTFSVNSQPEGLVTNDRNATLYLGVEEEGIYKIDAEPNDFKGLTKIEGSDATNPSIAYDVEGLALFTYKGEEYLMASIQGNFSYAIFRTGKEDKYLTSFIITDGEVDGVEETDGFDIIFSQMNEPEF
jgi:3-phytase